MLIQKRVAESATRRTRLREEEAGLLEKEMQLTQAFTGGDIAPNAFNREAAVIRATRHELGQIVAAAPTSTDQLAESVSRTLQLATSFWDLYEPMNEIRRASLLKSLFATIVLDHDGIAGFTLKPPFDELVKARRDQPQPHALAKAIVDAA